MRKHLFLIYFLSSATTHGLIHPNQIASIILDGTWKLSIFVPILIRTIAENAAMVFWWVTYFLFLVSWLWLFFSMLGFALLHFFCLHSTVTCWCSSCSNCTETFCTAASSNLSCVAKSRLLIWRMTSLPCAPMPRNLLSVVWCKIAGYLLLPEVNTSISFCFCSIFFLGAQNVTKIILHQFSPVGQLLYSN